MATMAIGNVNPDFVCTHWKHLGDVLLMSTHKIRFSGEIRKISIFFGCKSSLSRAMMPCEKV